METLIKVLFCILAVVLFCQCEKDSTPKVTIPDDNFLNALIELGVDTNGDGIISPAEAEEITYLDISEDSVSDMTGIEKFVNLDTLFCFMNQITSLDVSNNTKLLYLNCWTNQLSSLDVSNNTSLKLLICGYNQLTTLDVSNNTVLEFLYCSSNPLGTLDVSNHTSLEYLRCYNSQLTTLDVSNCTVLRTLFCQNNLYQISYNQLTTLDVSNCTALEQLFGDNNQLSTLDVSSNISLSYISLKGMPTLNKVCVWEMPFPPSGVEVFISNSPNVYFTTDCN